MGDQSYFTHIIFIIGGMTYNYSSYGSRNNEYRPKDKDQPLDTVSCLVWDVYKNDPGFIASSWDGYVRYYLVKQFQNTQVEKVWSMFLQHPVLCCDINQNNILFAGLATGDIAAIRLQNSEVVRLGWHDAPICGLFWLKEKGCLLSLGFDNLVRFWTLEGGNKPQMEITLPLKTHTASMDYPYLLIGSADSTVSIVNLKNLPNVKFPRNPEDYMKVSIEKFSRFNCSRIIGNDAKKIAVGTVDGRSSIFSFKETYDGFSIIGDPLVSRSQKTTNSRTALYGQVNCVDLGYMSYEVFALIGGTEDLTAYNIVKRSKGNTYSTSNSSTGAATAMRLSPKLDYLVYATGTDWNKGIHELQTLKKPKITLLKLTQSELKDLTQR